jgi:hypothetical protein
VQRLVAASTPLWSGVRPAGARSAAPSCSSRPGFTDVSNVRGGFGGARDETGRSSSRVARGRPAGRHRARREKR